MTPTIEQRITQGVYADVLVWDVTTPSGKVETFSNYTDAYNFFCTLYYVPDTAPSVTPKRKPVDTRVSWDDLLKLSF